ncbi:MAG: type II toxin-antitoxin system VapC family toxin [Planctomycetes bacterium]|nr:type II toxin-antitoxin system VapC family toxin [Planctomycetota bacterium]
MGELKKGIDKLRAATAIRHGMHLMTRNVVDFEPVGVLLINPWENA